MTPILTTRIINPVVADNHNEDVVAINRKQRVALLGNGSIVHFTSMFDCDGDKTNNSDEAYRAVAQLPSGTWACISLDQFEPIEIH